MCWAPTRNNREATWADAIQAWSIRNHTQYGLTQVCSTSLAIKRVKHAMQKVLVVPGSLGGETTVRISWHWAQNVNSMSPPQANLWIRPHDYNHGCSSDWLGDMLTWHRLLWGQCLGDHRNPQPWYRCSSWYILLIHGETVHTIRLSLFNKSFVAIILVLGTSIFDTLTYTISTRFWIFNNWRRISPSVAVQGLYNLIFRTYN